MYALIGLDRVCTFLVGRNCSYFALYDNETKSRNKVADNFSKTTQTTQDAISEFPVICPFHHAFFV